MAVECAVQLRLWLSKMCSAICCSDELLKTHRHCEDDGRVGECGCGWAQMSAPAHLIPRTRKVCVVKKKRYIAHWTDRHKGRQHQISAKSYETAGEVEKKMRIDKSKKRTKITCNDRTDAPDVYNYLCIAESEAHTSHSVLLCWFVSILVSTVFCLSFLSLFSLHCLLLAAFHFVLLLNSLGSVATIL